MTIRQAWKILLDPWTKRRESTRRKAASRALRKYFASQAASEVSK